MEYQLVIKNANYFANNRFNLGDILINDGKVSDIVTSDPDHEYSTRKIIDAQGLLVLPGIIDSHVHFREPGNTEREDFFSGSAAAAAGGVTTYCEMPTACPPPNNPVNLQKRIDLAAAKSIVDFAMFGAAGYDNIEQYQALLDMGVIAFKSFLQPLPKGREAEFAGLTVADEGQLYAMMEAGAQTKGRYFFHCENANLIASIEERLHQLGEEGFDFHYRSRLPLAEVQSVETILRFAQATGCKVGIVHITTPEACALVKAAQKAGVDVIAETCFHYLVYNHQHIDQYGPYAKCNPPLRSEEDMNRLWDYLFDGTISMIGSDHAPLTVEEKECGMTNGIWKAFSGMPAVEMLLPILLTQVAKGKITLEQLIPFISENTARVHGLYPRKGIISIGSDADFAIIDPNREYTVYVENMYSKAKEIAKLFAGTKVKGKPIYTIVRGRLVMEEGKVDLDGRGYGQYVSANR